MTVAAKTAPAGALAKPRRAISSESKLFGWGLVAPASASCHGGPLSEDLCVRLVFQQMGS